MNQSDQGSFSHKLSHVYVEEGVAEHPSTKRIIANLNDPSVIYTAHYKDIFCKKGQDFRSQKVSRQLVIAAKKPPFLYRGSDLCDSFGHQNFFYSSNAMNCVYDCGYCYLQGMYRSANLVVFVNTADIFKEIDKALAMNPVYLCNSYDTDLMAMEHLTGFCSEWIEFARERPDLTLEIRTKSTASGCIRNLAPAHNIILAWSVSPQEIVSNYEHHTPSAAARISAMRSAIDAGWNVRLCIDPVLRTDGWRGQYAALAEQIRSKIDIGEFCDYSIGVFRVPEDSLKAMRKINPGLDLLAFPFFREAAGTTPDIGRAAQKVYTYNEAQRSEMIAYVEGCINK